MVLGKLGQLPQGLRCVFLVVTFQDVLDLARDHLELVLLAAARPNPQEVLLFLRPGNSVKVFCQAGVTAIQGTVEG